MVKCLNFSVNFFATNFFNKCMAIRLKIFYTDIGALKVIVPSEVAPGAIPVSKYLKNQTY